MAVFKKFVGSNASHYNNSLHAGYHTAQLKQLEKVGEESLELMHVSGEKYEVYAGTVGDLTERSLEPQASTATGETTALDVERDRLLSMLFFLVASGMLSAVAAERAAAQQLDVILRMYKGIQEKAMDEETQRIRGLLVDLNKSENAEAVTALRLGEILTQLESVNNQFDAVKETRFKARHAKKLQIKTPELRALADTQLEEIQDLIRATGIIASTDPDQEILMNMVSDLMDDMNSVTDNYKTVFNQSTAQKNANKNPEEQPEEKPEENPSADEKGEGNLEFVPVDK